MNYLRIYNNIVHNAKTRIIPKDVYYEKHHIIPRSLGGSDKVANIVKLLPREHYLVHWLLTKIYVLPKSDHSKMIKAFLYMGTSSVSHGGHRKRMTSRLFSRLKSQLSYYRSLETIGDKNPMHGRIWAYNEELEINKVFNSDDELQEGWKRGKKDWSLYSKDIFNKEIANALWNNYSNSDCNNIKDFCKKINYNLGYNHLRKLFKTFIKDYSGQKTLKYKNAAIYWWKLYKESGLTDIKEFIIKYNYDKSYLNLLGLWRKYVQKEYNIYMASKNDDKLREMKSLYEEFINSNVDINLFFKTHRINKNHAIEFWKKNNIIESRYLNKVEDNKPKYDKAFSKKWRKKYLDSGYKSIQKFAKDFNYPCSYVHLRNLWAKYEEDYVFSKRNISK